jgi:membrane protein implicated in regulation of membrane protease activity
MKNKISEANQTKWLDSITIAILTILVLILALIVALILHFGFRFISICFSWKISISYWIFFSLILAIFLILFIWALLSSKKSNSPKSKTYQHHEDTMWISSFLDNDY